MFKGMFPRKFLRFHIAAIRRYGERHWSFDNSIIEFNPNYTVSVSKEVTGIFNDDYNIAYLFELSNGTRFIAFIRAIYDNLDAFDSTNNGILSADGERSNSLTTPDAIARVKEKLDEFNRIKYRA